MASTVHTDDQLFLDRAYAALYRWMNANDYRLIGPPHLVYLRQEMDQRQCVVELQFPVGR